MTLHPVFAVGIILMGWFGFALRRSSIGGAVAILVTFEGVLALAALCVFLDRRKGVAGGAVFLWTLFFGAAVFLIGALALALRQYYAHRSVRMDVNQEIRH